MAPEARRGYLIAGLLVWATALFVAPGSRAWAQDAGRAVFAGSGYATTSADDYAGSIGSGPLFAAGIMVHRSERVFLDVDLTYGLRDFELEGGELPLRGTDFGAGVGFGVLLLTEHAVLPFVGAGVGMMRSAHRIRGASVGPLDAGLEASIDTAWGPFVQLGGGVRIIAGEAVFVQGEWVVLWRHADAIPHVWKAGTLAVGYRF